MAGRPEFKRHFRCEVVPSEGVFLLSETEQVRLRGRVYPLLGPLLDGRHTEDEIADLLFDRLSAAEVFYAIDHLRSQGYVVDAVSHVSAPEAAFWDVLGVSPEAATASLTRAVVSITPLGGVDGAQLAEALASLGAREGADGALRVVVTDDYLRPEIDALNRAALAGSAPWMLLKPVGSILWLGPIFVPHRTGCWECLAHRLAGHRKVERYLAERERLLTPSAGALPALASTRQAAFGLAATQIARWIASGRNDELEGRLVTLSAISLEKRDHVLTRRQQCPRCGDAGWVAARQSTPPRLERRPKAFTADGGHRALAPRETLSRLLRHVSPITGIVGALEDSFPDGGGRGVVFSYVTDSGSILLREHTSSLLESLRSLGGGKGRDEAQARTSALSEAIERYSSAFHDEEARITSSLYQLGAAGLHPNACMLFSEAQLERSGPEDPRKAKQAWIAEPFDERRQIEWSPAWSLSTGERRFVPTALCYLGYSHVRSAWFARADSNGCAAGNTLEEAILQGFMELVERDSVALWWYNRARRPGVDLDSFGEPYFSELRAYYRSLGRELWVLDVTTDLEIPAFAAVSRLCSGGPEELVLGFGAHFDARVAALRAVTEVNQLLPSVLASPAGAARDPWWKTATVAGERYLAPDESRSARVAADFSSFGSDDLYTDVMTCVRIASERNLETLVLDQTRPDTGLHVVKVIVPGLRHFWPRLGPGRLYDVPPRLGWTSGPLKEAELNLHPVYW